MKKDLPKNNEKPQFSILAKKTIKQQNPYANKNDIM